MRRKAFFFRAASTFSGILVSGLSELDLAYTTLVKVSDYAPRHPSLMPTFLIYFLSTLVQYIITLSVTFGMINMLPIPFLDGSELVQAVLQSYNLRFLSSSTSRSDLIELEVGRSTSHKHQQISLEKHTVWLLNALTLSLVAFALGGSLILHFIDSTV